MSELPSPKRMMQLAILVLEEAAEQAMDAPIERTPAHRLALAWLAYAGVAERWQVDAFWTLLAEPAKTESLGDYCRHRDFHIWLTAWRRTAGLPK